MPQEAVCNARGMWADHVSGLIDGFGPMADVIECICVPSFPRLALSRSVGLCWGTIINCRRRMGPQRCFGPFSTPIAPAADCVDCRCEWSALVKKITGGARDDH